MKPTLTEKNISIFGIPLRKESKQTKDENSGLWVEPRYSFRTMGRFYDWNTWHRRCILIKAGATCGMGWRLVTDDDNKEPDEEYKRIEAFLVKPNISLGNRQMSFTRIAYRIAIDYFHLGNAYLEVVHNKKGELAELYHAPAMSMRVGWKEENYWQIRHGKNVKFAPYSPTPVDSNEIAHLAAYDPVNDYYGMPEWLPAMATMALDRNAVSYNTYNFENEFLAKVLLFFKGATLGKSVKNKLRQFFSGEYKGVENAGKAVVIDVDDPNVEIQVEKLQMDQKDISFLESRRFNRDEIVESHNVPPRLLGIISAGKLGEGNEIAGQLKIFRDVTLTPPKTDLEEFFNSILVPGLGMTKWRLEFKTFDITTILEDATFLAQVGPYLNDDEARQVIGYKPRQDAPGPATAALIKNLVALRKEIQNDGDDDKYAE